MSIWSRLSAVFAPKKTEIDEPDLDSFEQFINYRFNNRELLIEALTHRSYAKSVDLPHHLPSNERLEFLGDSVLGLIVSDFLYQRYPRKLEGGLTKLKAIMVNEISLSRVADELALGGYIRMSAEEERSGGRTRPSITADAFEAVIGALYLDGGLVAAKPFVSRWLLSKIEIFAADVTLRNYKGDLLEYLQAQGNGMPRYDVTDERGPDHDKTFTVAVFTNGREIGRGVGPTKKDAEQKAAAEALLNLEVD
jgi:ribonuclease-3